MKIIRCISKRLAITLLLLGLFVLATMQSLAVAGATYHFRVPIYGVPTPASLQAPPSYAIANAYATLPGAVDFEGLYPNETLEIWFKTTQYGILFNTTGSPWGIWPPTKGYDPYLYVGTDGLLRGGAWSGASSVITCTGKSVQDGRWHFATLSLSSNRQSVYLDGGLCGTAAISLEPWQPSGYSYIGGGEGGGEASNWPGYNISGWVRFQGDWYGVAVWKVTRTATQVTADMKQIAPVAPGLVVYYPVNGGSGSALKDASPNGNTAALSAPNWVGR